MTPASASEHRPPRTRRPTTISAWFWVATAAGTLHAAATLYWAVGGTWLLETVGQWAVEAREENRLLTSLGLALVGLAKLAGAWVPVLVEQGRLPWRAMWRTVAWGGGGALALYSMVNTVGGILALTGVIDLGGADNNDPTVATAGQALLWQPLFLVWAVALLGGLWRSRRV